MDEDTRVDVPARDTPPRPDTTPRAVPGGAVVVNLASHAAQLREAAAASSSSRRARDRPPDAAGLRRATSPTPWGTPWRASERRAAGEGPNRGADGEEQQPRSSRRAHTPRSPDLSAAAGTKTEPASRPPHHNSAAFASTLSQQRSLTPMSPPLTRHGLITAAVATTVDGLWQVRPPRLLEYEPRALHTIGWLPRPTRRALAATVFADRRLHSQTLALVLWTLLLHLTGLGVPAAHRAHFCEIFGTAYLGSLASMGVIIALVLGLFVSLVVQRWWDVRSRYAEMHGCLLDAAVTFAREAKRSRDQDGEEDGEEERRGETVTREFLRLLNLAHVTFLSQAGEKEHTVQDARKALKNAERSGDAASSSRDDSLRNGGKGGSSESSDDDDPGTTDGVDDRGPVTRNPAAPPEPPDVLAKHVAHLTGADCERMGLVTRAEWRRLRRAQAVGMPRFVAVLTWCGDLVAGAERRALVSAGGAARSRAKLSDAQLAAGKVLTFLNSQLPYPYVYLVSLVVHVYLFALATWFGFLMSAGLNRARAVGVALEGGLGEESDGGGISVLEPQALLRRVVQLDGARRDDGGSGSIDYAAADSEYSTGRAFAFAFDSTDRSLRSDGLTLGFGYAFVAFSNVLFQGLLNMHALLDNPFGEHPAKFPLRAYVAQLIGVTNALAAGAHDAPGDAAWVRALRREEGEKGGKESE